MPDNEGADIESGWERREPFLDLAPPTVGRMLEPLYGARALASIEPLTHGLANTNYRVQVAGSSRSVVLRIYTRDPDACPRDEALFRLVRNRVPVPELLFADASGTRYERPYAVLSWIEGISLAAGLREAPYAVGRTAGETLAAIGAHTFPQPGFFTPDLAVSRPPNGEALPFLGHIEHCLDTGAADRLGEPLATSVREFVRRNAVYLPPESRLAALVHGDFKAGNILVRNADGRWTVAGVLDWEFAFAGPPIFDMSILLRYSDQLPPDFERGVLAGLIAAGGVLPPEWKRTIRLLDFVNLCDFLRTPGRGAALVSDVTGLIVRTMRDWATYR